MKRISKKDFCQTLIDQCEEIGIKEFVRVLCDMFDADSLSELSDQIEEEFYNTGLVDDDEE